MNPSRYVYLEFRIYFSRTDQIAVSQAVIKPGTDCFFTSQATYVISGGLGAQGRYVASWMVSKGARHLVLLSRSGPDKNETLVSFVDELRASGAIIYCPRCDISQPSSVAAVIDYCRANMPPIKGCIQAATVYRVSKPQPKACFREQHYSHLNPNRTASSPT